ncbi:MAG: aldo/keto reductase [bacterium]
MENSLIDKAILGKSGLSVSRLCYGTLALSPYHSNPSKEKAFELLNYAYSRGINFWDTAELYDNYDLMSYALKNIDNNKDIIISSRCYAKTYDEMSRAIDEALSKLSIDKISIFGLHEVYPEELKNGYFRKDAFFALIKAKEEGKISAISITSHSVKSVEHSLLIDEIDIIMPLINYKGLGILDGTKTDMLNAINNAKSKQKGIFAMKVLGGGFYSKDVRKALAFVLNNRNIDSIAIGMDDIEEIKFNISIFQNSITDYDIENKLKLKNKRISIEPWCENCGKCVKTCPQNAIYNEYGMLKADDKKCVRCGYCIPACKYFNIKFLNQNETI